MANRSDALRDDLVRRAERELGRRAYAKAADLYRQALRYAPKDLKLARKLAEACVRGGRTAEAKQAYLSVAQGYREQQLYLKAIGAYKAASDLDPGDFRIREELAGCYVTLGLVGDASAVLGALAAEQETRGLIQAAAHTREQVFALVPKDVLNALQLAELLTGQNRGEEARVVYESLLEQLRDEPSSGQAFLRVAERAAAAGMVNVELMREVARRFLDQGDATSGLRWLQACESAVSDDPQTLQLFARLFEATGDEQRHAAVVRQMSSHPPPPPATLSPLPCPPGSPFPSRQAAPPPEPRPSVRSRISQPATPCPGWVLALGPDGEGAPAEGSGDFEIIFEEEMDNSFPESSPVTAPDSSGWTGAGGSFRATIPPALPPGIEALLDHLDFEAMVDQEEADSSRPTVLGSDFLAPESELGCEARSTDPVDMSGAFAEKGSATEEDSTAGELEFASSARPTEPAGERMDSVGLFSSRAWENARQQELDRLITAVETLLDFDVVDKAVEVAGQAVTLSPGSSRARALLRLAKSRQLWLRGDVGQGSPSGGKTGGSHD